MHPKVFEQTYIRVDILQTDLKNMLHVMDELDKSSLNDYDKGGLDGYKQAVTEILKKLDSLMKKHSS